MNEAVTVNRKSVKGGTPTLTLNDGGTATYTRGSGTNSLTFSYTVAAGQSTSAMGMGSTVKLFHHAGSSPLPCCGIARGPAKARGPCQDRSSAHCLMGMSRRRLARSARSLWMADIEHGEG
jgi:hypothetical protein